MRLQWDTTVRLTIADEGCQLSDLPYCSYWDWTQDADELRPLSSQNARANVIYTDISFFSIKVCLEHLFLIP